MDVRICLIMRFEWARYQRALEWCLLITVIHKASTWTKSLFDIKFYTNSPKKAHASCQSHYSIIWDNKFENLVQFGNQADPSKANFCSIWLISNVSLTMA